MPLSRASGVLAHPTVLPGPWDKGDLGPGAYAFVDQLQAAGQRWWQMLPLNPPGFGGSPYAALSAFAGDPDLISLERLVEEGLLVARDLADPPQPERPGRVDPQGSQWRRERLARAWQSFKASASDGQLRAFADFVDAEGYWLADFADFMVAKAVHGGGSFFTPACGWPLGLRRRIPHAVLEWRRPHRAEIELEYFAQFLFQRQLGDLRAYARERGVKLMGDLPIFVAHDSADAWAHPELFCFGPDGQPTVVAGVPPDYFSEEGQLWGNPLYDWDVHARTGYVWWIERLRQALQQADAVRIDHFRGFASYWEIPATAETAKQGKWVPGPGMQLFEAIGAALGEVPVVAEDLGDLTPDVPKLLEASGFPGMKVLQFAWCGEPDHPFLPANIEENSVVYTGTHDNQTTRGWWTDAKPAEKKQLLETLGEDAEQDPVWALIEAGLGSRAVLMITPIQDLLDLGDEARMNEPGETSPDNWSWRANQEQLDGLNWERLKWATEAANRS